MDPALYIKLPMFSKTSLRNSVRNSENQKVSFHTTFENKISNHWADNNNLSFQSKIPVLSIHLYGSPT